VVSQATNVKIDFDWSKAKIENLPDLVASSQTLDNRNSDIEQSMSFTFSKTITTTRSWSHTSGYTFGREVGTSIMTGASVEVGTEYMGVSVSASVTVEETKSLTKSESWSSEDSYGGENSEEETWSATSNVVVPAGKIYRCEATIKRAEVTIPYTGTVSFDKAISTKQVYGSFSTVKNVIMHQVVTDLT